MRINVPRINKTSTFLALILSIAFGSAYGADDPVDDGPVEDGPNASNPLAAVTNIDFRAKYFDLGNGSDRYTYSLEGATMLHPEDQTEV